MNKQIIKKIIPLLFIRLFGALIVFLTQIFLARKLSVTDVGMINFYLSLFSFLVVTSNFGLSKTLLQYISNKDRDSETFTHYGIKKSLRYNIILVAGLLVSALFLYDINTQQFTLYIFFIMALPLTSTVYILSDLYKAKGNHLNSILVWNVIFSCVIFIYVLFEVDLNVLTIPIIYAFVSMLFVFKNRHIFRSNMRPTWALDNIESLVNFNIVRIRFCQISFIEEGIRWAPMLMIGFFSFESAAYYNVALRISMIFNMLLMVMNVIAPSSIGEFKRNNDIIGIRTYMRNLRHIMMFVGISLIGAVVFFGPRIIALFGEQYGSSYILAVTLTSAVVINGLFGPVPVTLQILGHEKEVRNTSLVSLVLLLLGLTLLLGQPIIYVACLVLIVSMYRSISLFLRLRKHLAL